MFKEIFVEEECLGLPVTRDVLDRYKKNARIVVVRHYKDTFSRGDQNIALQKRHKGLILARKPPPYIYEGSKNCAYDSNPRSYYVVPLMNCVYDCEYCFLKGMYPSGNLVYFVNHQEIMEGVRYGLSSHLKARLAISFETDLLALDQCLSCLEPWLTLARTMTHVEFELRTKGARLGALRHTYPLENFIISWSLSPPNVKRVFEKDTPSLSSRLSAAKDALILGWNVRFSIDPVLFVESWRAEYEILLEKVAELNTAYDIVDLTVGPFRMAKEHLRSARKRYPFSPLLHYPYELRDGVYTYPGEVLDEMLLEIKALSERLGLGHKLSLVGPWALGS